ncbi:MAG TPA: hybrid sensor histidine kinase/response regulator [Noviherbaspirillum sp.]|uniref:hybrid sensor histidine kinase/response regulator n=1 Tax=Noviherbaspirillum sp. TaxID=1926288 RepID=UPI002D377BE8|nr:hybrid sensor histidine kinase/response regulator [Noviherbaspirillum sp.]HYD97564.1 hybrid sensor histidine kinase/response regulator [Noviherbaspirillum sp.]
MSGGNGNKDYSGLSLLELFRNEAETQVQVLNTGLLALDRNARDLAAIEPLMRAAHSLKGAARIVNLDDVERLAHAMEDCFVAAQKGKLHLGKARIDRLLAGVDLIGRISALDEQAAPAWLDANRLHIGEVLIGVYDAADPDKLADDALAEETPAAVPPPPRVEEAAEAPAPASRDEQVLKVNVRNFDRLLSLASEARVAAHALEPYLQSLQRFKKMQHEMLAALEQLHQELSAAPLDEALRERLLFVHGKSAPLKQVLGDRIDELETFERRLLAGSQEMLDEVLTLRMRPFRDGVHALPRMVRDLARSLGKEVRLVVAGEDTLVDRDILARIESPLNHILRNAVDHGMESPEERSRAGKPAEGTIMLEARHSAGMLAIRVSDDGRGVDIDRIRSKIVERKMASTQMAGSMSMAELLDFLFLPAFSLKDSASEVSGRGVGLDVVQATVRELNGSVRLESDPGKGFRTFITLPVSQSVVRAVVTEIAGEAYAVPITKIERVMHLEPGEIRTLEDRQFFSLGSEHIGLVSAAQLLELGDTAASDRLAVLLIGGAQRRYALVVDRIIGEQNLAVQPLEPIFGKMRDISSAALLDDGTPVLILDIADMLVSIEKMLSEGGLKRLQKVIGEAATKTKRILVVDDSLTVREMERKLLSASGFDVDVAVDGMDGWNAVRSSDYDLVVTDVDMPRMDGIELVTLIKKDSRLHNLPVMIVSYKDRPEDRARGITAGADYYLTKGSFHDETLLEAVFDLIGTATDEDSNRQ